jgi:hypothetical protein
VQHTTEKVIPAALIPGDGIGPKLSKSPSRWSTPWPLRWRGKSTRQGWPGWSNSANPLPQPTLDSTSTAPDWRSTTPGGRSYHSERRALFGETDEEVNRKVLSALNAGLNPILCVGESLEERESGRVEERLGQQLRWGLTDVPPKNFSEVVIAYEPVWAIGTGQTATPDQAQAAHAFIRPTTEQFLRRFSYLGWNLTRICLNTYRPSDGNTLSSLAITIWCQNRAGRKRKI